MISGHDALCCLMASAVESATDAAATPEEPGGFDHVYPSSAMTWPYCDHHAVVGRVASISTQPPPQGQVTDVPREDPHTTGTIRFHRFDLHVVRCGPPSPDSDSTRCLGDLYGDCDSPPNHHTLAGHHLAVDLETERLMSEILERWCDCLVARNEGYSRTRPRWIEEATIQNEGRFTAIALRVGTLLG